MLEAQACARISEEGSVGRVISGVEGVAEESKLKGEKVQGEASGSKGNSGPCYCVSSLTFVHSTIFSLG